MKLVVIAFILFLEASLNYVQFLNLIASVEGFRNTAVKYSHVYTQPRDFLCPIGSRIIRC